MSEFTDYIQFLSDAQTYDLLQSQLVRTAGAASVPPFAFGGWAGSVSDLATEWAALDKPAWVMIGLEEPSTALPKLGAVGTAFHLLVEEDFVSWTLALQCGSTLISKTFLKHPEGQYREATVYYGEDNLWPTSGDPTSLARIAACLGVSTTALSKTFVADGGQSFSALVGAHYEQMADISSPYPALEPGELRFLDDF